MAVRTRHVDQPVARVEQCFTAFDLRSHGAARLYIHNLAECPVADEGLERDQFGVIRGQGLVARVFTA